MFAAYRCGQSHPAGRTLLAGSLLILILCPVITACAHKSASRPAKSQPAPVVVQSTIQPDIYRWVDDARQASAAGDYPTAERKLSVALREAQTQHNGPTTAVVLSVWGEVREDMGDLAGALSLQQQALQAGGPKADPQNVANVLNDQGNLDDELGQYEPALDSYQRALPLYRQEKDEKDAAACLCNMGLVCGHMGQVDRGLGYLQTSVEMDLQRHDETALASSYNNIGLLYDLIGQDDKALDYYRRALEIKQRGNNLIGTAHSLNNICNIYQQQGNLAEAYDYGLRALKIKRKLNNPLSLANTIDNLAGIALARGQLAQALRGYQQTLDLRLRNHASPQEVADTIENIGEVRFQQGRYAAALGAYRRALTLRAHLINGINMVDCLCHLGGAYAALGQYGQAETYYQRGVRVYERLSAHLSDADQYGSLEKATHNLYAQYARILSRHRSPLAGLLMAERGRAQGLAKQAAWNRLDFSRLLAPEDARRLDGCARALDQATRARQFWEQQEVPARSEAAARFQARQAAAIRSYEQAVHDDALLRESLRTRYPQFRQIEGRHPLTQPDLAALMRGRPDTLYLEYLVVDDDTTLLFALSARRGLRLFTLPVGEKTLTREVTRWRADLTEQRLALAAQARRLERREAWRLYRALLGPADAAGLLPGAGMPGAIGGHGAAGADRIASAGHIVIVPDGPLCDLPFAALCDGRGQRLIQRCAVSQAISLDVLCWPRSAVAPQKSLLCIGDPLERGDAVPLVTSRGPLGPLKYARQEVNAIASLFPGAEALVGKQANEKAVRDRMERYNILHFATHGVLDARNGLQSALALASDSGDGYALLSARDIADMRLTASLAVLSACETALGQRSGGEGLLGLAWAFRAAGCGCVTASQWRVDDLATARLMTAFYTGLRGGLDKAEALRQAMLRVAADPQSADPFYWAGFVLMGETSPLPR
jgi:tetratricopeptide (TPR) repeat protein